MYSQSVPQKTVQKVTTKDNSGTLPINLFAANSPTEAAAVSVPHRETTETLYKLSQIVCVKADFNDSHRLSIVVCLQENVSVGMKRVKTKVFIQDPFDPVLFTKDEERYVDVRNIVHALTCYNCREDVVELEEGNLILLLDVLHRTNEVVTVAEAAETVEMTETAADEVQHGRIPRRRNRRFESDSSTINTKVKQVNKYAEQ